MIKNIELPSLNNQVLDNRPHEKRLGWLKNGGVPCDIRSLPKCQATAKHSGKRCGNIAMKGKTVCYIHGGKGGAPKGKRNGSYKNGNYTKESIEYSKRFQAVTRLFTYAYLGKPPPSEEQVAIAIEEMAKTKKKKSKKVKRIYVQHWCVFQRGGGIWGIGTSKESAIRDAEYHITGEWWLFNETEYLEAPEGDYVVLPCSERVYDGVDANGGAIRYRVVKGQVRVQARLKPGPKRKRKSKTQ